MKKIIYIFSIVIVVLFLSGCVCVSSSYRNLNILSQYNISPLPSEKRINKIVGLNSLTDNRPLKEIKERDNLQSWLHPLYSKLEQPVSDIVTSILLKDFKKSRLFKEIHYPAQPTDDIIINGSINRLFGDYKVTSWGKFREVFPTPLFPVFWLPDIFGVPISQEYTAIDISLEVKDSKTGVIIASFNASSKEDVESRTVYGRRRGRSAAIAFRNVANKLKEDMIEKIKHYYNIN